MATKTFVARPLNDLDRFSSFVDIIVPYYGQYEKVTRLLESIFLLTRTNYYRVFVVDDCSPNATYVNTIRENSQKNAQRLHQQNIVTAIRNETQLGFAGACKIGFEAGNYPYVCFVQSDCVVKDPNWLRAMGNSLLDLKEKSVRMVAPMTNNPVGGDPSQQGEFMKRDQEDVILADDSHLSMYCFMCHRELFNHVGGFLKEYPYGYYEDEEFAGRLHKYGFKQAVCRRSWIQHEGGATITSFLRANPNLRPVLEEENRQRCIEDLKNLR